MAFTQRFGMSTAIEKKAGQSKEAQRLEVRSLIHLAGEPISHFWPMETFIHHNPLHGLEHLEFHQAIERARQILGGQGYQSNRYYQNLYQEGRITDEHITDAILPLTNNRLVTIGERNISDMEVLRTVLIHGTGLLPEDVRAAAFERTIQDPQAKAVHQLLDSQPRS